MKPDTIAVIPTCLTIPIWAYRRMGVHRCNRIGVPLYGCNRMSVSPSGGRRSTKPVVNVGVGVVMSIQHPAVEVGPPFPCNQWYVDDDLLIRIFSVPRIYHPQIFGRQGD